MAIFGKIKLNTCQLLVINFILLIIGSQTYNIPEGGANTEDGVAQELLSSVKSSSEKLKWATRDSVKKLDSNLRTASIALENSAKTFTNSWNAEILGFSRELVKISDELISSINKSVEVMSAALEEAVKDAKNVAKQLTNTSDKSGINYLEENVLGTVKEVAKDLTESLDKGVDELGTTVRYLADSIVKISKQFNARIDSGDIVKLGKEMKEGLVNSITQLSSNWKVALSTADLKGVGAEAAKELRIALQNIKARFEVNVGIDNNTRLAVKDISIAVGIAFSVLFIAIVVALKSCRECTTKCFQFAVVECSKSRKPSPKDEETGTEQMEGLSLKTITPNEKGKPKQETKKFGVKSENDTHDTGFSSSDTDDDDLGGKRKKRKFDKRLTKSFADYKDFDKMKAKWERREARDTSRNEDSIINEIRAPNQSIFRLFNCNKL